MSILYQTQRKFIKRHESGGYCLDPLSTSGFGLWQTSPCVDFGNCPGNHADLLLALITSRDYQAVPEFDEVVDLTDNDFKSTGLKTRSVIRLARLASVEASIVNARLGGISPERLKNLKDRLIRWLQER